MTTTKPAAAAAAPKSPKKVVVKKKVQRTKVAPSSPKLKRKKPVTTTKTGMKKSPSSSPSKKKAVANQEKGGRNTNSSKKPAATTPKLSSSSSYPPLYQLQIDTDEIFKSFGGKASITPPTVFFDKLKQQYKSKTVLAEDQKAAVRDRLQYLTERQDDDDDDNDGEQQQQTQLDTPWPDEKIVSAVDNLFFSTEDINQIRVKQFCTNLHQKYHFFMPESTKRLIKKRLKDLALGQAGDNDYSNNVAGGDKEDAKMNTQPSSPSTSAKKNEKTGTEGGVDALGESPVKATVDKLPEKKKTPSKSAKKTSQQKSVENDSQESNEKEKDEEINGKTAKSKKTVVTTAKDSKVGQAKDASSEAKLEDDDDDDDDHDKGEGPMLSTLKTLKKKRSNLRVLKTNAEEQKEEEQPPRKRAASISEAKEDDDDAYGEGPMLSTLKKNRTNSSVSKTDNDDDKEEPSKKKEEQPPKKRSRKDSTSPTTSKSKPSTTKAVATGRAPAAASATTAAATTTAATSGDTNNKQHIGDLIDSLRRDLEKDKKVRTERLRKAKMHAQAAKMSYENCLSVIEELEKDDYEHSRRIDSTLAMLIQEQNKK